MSYYFAPKQASDARDATEQRANYPVPLSNNGDYDDHDNGDDANFVLSFYEMRKQVV